MTADPAAIAAHLPDARVSETLRVIDNLRASLFTLNDFGMRLGLEVAGDNIKRAQRDLEAALRNADRRIEEARASLADHPRHYGTSE